MIKKLFILILILFAPIIVFASSQQTSSTAASAIIDRVEVYLNDTNNKMWLATELLTWLNDGMIDIVNRTHCLETTETINLQANILEYAVTSTYTTVKSVHYIDEKVTNGTMETNGNWAAVNGATVAQSSSQANAGTYSFKITTDAADEGAKSDTFTTTDDTVYYYRAYIYPDDGTSMNVQVIAGDGSTSLLDSDKTSLTQDAWNLVTGTFTETAPGSAAYLAFRSPTGETGTDNYYIDDVSIYSQRKALQMSSPEIVGGAQHEVEPKYWYEWAGSIGVYPSLSTVSAEKITIYVVTRPTAIASTANVTTPQIYDKALVLYICAQAWLKDLKPSKYFQMMSLYEAELMRLRGELNEFPKQIVE
jgi:hypothetical protein